MRRTSLVTTKSTRRLMYSDILVSVFLKDLVSIFVLVLNLVSFSLDLSFGHKNTPPGV